MTVSLDRRSLAEVGTGNGPSGNSQPKSPQPSSEGGVFTLVSEEARVCTGHASLAKVEWASDTIDGSLVPLE